MDVEGEITMRMVGKKISFFFVSLFLVQFLSGCSYGGPELGSKAIENQDSGLVSTQASVYHDMDGDLEVLDKKFKESIALYLGMSDALVFGLKSKIDRDNPALVAFSEKGRSFVPLRFVSEALGAEISWNEKESRVQIHRDGIDLKIGIGSKTMHVNGKAVFMDASPRIKEGRTFIPLRYIGEALGKNIFYQEGLIVISPLGDKIEAKEDKDLLDKFLREMKDSEALTLLKKANNWAYQLQDFESQKGIKDLLVSKYDVLVLEPVRTIKGQEAFDTRAMVKKIKGSKGSDGKRRKLVFAYINIGEAEDWRWYWNWSLERQSTWPSYIIGGDPEGWSGDYPVAYWDKDWKNLCMYGAQKSPGKGYSSLMEEALADGFDGVYLDWVEGYSERMVQERAVKDKVDAKEEMIKLLLELRAYSKEKNQDFLMIQKNASELYKGFPQAFEAIDAIAQEAIWYDGSSFEDWEDPAGADIVQGEALSNSYIENLKKYKEMGKLVFNVEYAERFKEEAFKKSKSHGFIPYCSKRPLSRLLPNF